MTGQWPDLIGFDIGGIELSHSRNLDSVPFSRMLEECRRQFERGGKVTLSWHARNPLTGANSWDTTPCLAQIIDPDTDVHDTMQVWIERAAAFIAQVAASSAFGMSNPATGSGGAGKPARRRTILLFGSGHATI